MRKKIGATLAVILFLLFTGETRGESAAKSQPADVDIDSLKGGPKEAYSPKRASELSETIESLDFLLRQKKNSRTRIKIVLNRASKAVTLGQLYALKGKPTREMSKEEVKYFSMAYEDAETALAQKGLPGKVQFVAHYIAGKASIGLENMDNAARHFKLALELYPEHPNAATAALFLAEYDFDKEKYNEALQLYAQYADKMNASQRLFAIYKTAWCYINLHNYQEAEKYFIKVIQNKQSKDFVKDATRDLAFVAYRFRSEDQIIALSQELFGQAPEARLGFLDSIFEYYLRDNIRDRGEKILAILLAKEGSPDKKLSLLLRTMPPVRRMYASQAHFGAFGRIASAYGELKKRPDLKNQLAELEPQVEVETEILTKAYLETFSARVRTPEKFSQPELAKRLKSLFGFYERNFKHRPKFQTMMSLWVEVCKNAKDYECIYQLSERIQKEPKLSSMVADAEVDSLSALEKLAELDPKKYEPAFIVALEKFVLQKRNSPKWSEIAKRLSGLYTQRQQYAQALPLINELHQRENSDDSFYRLEWVRFQLGQHDEVIAGASQRWQSGAKRDGRVMEMVKESSLKIAQKSEIAKDFGSYEKNIKLFMTVEKDEGKVGIARRNYFAKLMEQKQFTKLKDELLTLDVARRLSKDYVDFARTSFYAFVRTGEFAVAASLVSGAPVGNSNPMNYELVLVTFLLKGSLDLNAWRSLDSASRKHLLGILSLTRPQEVIAYLGAARPSDKDERELGLLAYRMLAGKDEIVVNSQQAKLLGDVVTEALLPVPPSQAETYMSKMRFPASNARPEQIAKDVQRLVSETRNLRGLVAADMKKQRMAGQIRILAKAREVEQRTADVILSAPIPAGLNEDETRQYTDKIAEIAKEFGDQALEYAKVEETASKNYREQIEKRKAEELPKPAGWELPTGFEVIKSRARPETMHQVLFLMDWLKAKNEMTDAVYFDFRAGFLLTQYDHQAMRNYVRQELETAERNELLEKWRGPKA